MQAYSVKGSYVACDVQENRSERTVIRAAPAEVEPKINAKVLIIERVCIVMGEKWKRRKN